MSQLRREQIPYDLRGPVIDAARSAAVALAHFWDALRLVEIETGLEFDGTVNVISQLAAEFDAPADASQMASDDVLNSLEMIEIVGERKEY